MKNHRSALFPTRQIDPLIRQLTDKQVQAAVSAFKRMLDGKAREHKLQEFLAGRSYAGLLHPHAAVLEG